MSGRPNPKGIADVKAIILNLRKVHKEMETVKQVLTVNQTRCTYLIEEERALHKALHEEMFAMDVHTSGNAGDEARMKEFLIGLLEEEQESKE